MRVCGLIVALILVGVTQSWADTRYVSDRLVITVREGMGNQFRVIKTIETDTPLDILDTQGNYLFVRLEDGVEGYVLKQYISRNVPKTAVIAKLKQELAAVETKLKTRSSLADSLSATNAELEETMTQLRRELDQARQELATTQQAYEELQHNAENVVLIDQERQRLKKEFTELSAKTQQLEQENASMLKTAMIKWFLAGGGVLFLGWVAGKFSRKKRRSLGSF